MFFIGEFIGFVTPEFMALILQKLLDLKKHSNISTGMTREKSENFLSTKNSCYTKSGIIHAQHLDEVVVRIHTAMMMFFCLIALKTLYLLFNIFKSSSIEEYC